MEELFSFKYVDYQEALSFKMPEYQRGLNKSHKNRISRDIIKNNTYVSEPILISKDLFVIDGQHRLSAYLQHKKTTCKIPVLIRNEKAHKEVFLQANSQKPVTASHKAYISDIGGMLRDKVKISITQGHILSNKRKYDEMSAIELLKGIYLILKDDKLSHPPIDKMFEELKTFSKHKILTSADDFIRIYQTYLLNTDPEKFMITIPYMFAKISNRGISKEKDIIRVANNTIRKFNRPALTNIDFRLYFMASFNKGIRKNRLNMI